MATLATTRTTTLLQSARFARGLVRLTAVLFLAGPLLAQHAPPQRMPPPPPPPRSAGPQSRPYFGRPNGAPRPQHLSQWMQQRSQLSPQEQQRALQQEPGFRQLPPETQQRVMNRLQQLNQMPPAQRSRILDRNEALERLSPQQRMQYRGAAQQLGGMPLDRRRAVARTFRDLRELPPDQRAAALNSPAYRSQFSDPERETLSNLLAVEPYNPPQPPPR